MRELKDELDPPFEIIEPAEWVGPVLFNSPHSGSIYPPGFLATSRLDTGTLRRSEDSFVDELVIGVVRRGYPLMRAHFPRCYVDVNREPYELDPRMFDGRLPSFANTRSMRVAGGLGTIARVVGDAQEIYGQRIPVDDAIRRIETLYKPYHRALRRLFTRIHRDFGVAVLIDCHSMPSMAGSKDERPRADVVLGDRYGTSCVPAVAETIESTLRRRAIRSAATSPMRAASSPSITATRPPGCIRCSSNSIARSIWTSGAMNVRRRSPGWPPISKLWPIRWRRSRSRNCGLIALRPNSRKSVAARAKLQKRPQKRKRGRPLPSGPSLGRKRPRRAAVTRGATAPQQVATAPHKRQG